MLSSAILAIAASSFSAPAVFEQAQLVDGMRCATMVKPLVATQERPFCCTACHHPYLLTNAFETVSVLKSADVEQLSSYLESNVDGSGQMSAFSAMEFARMTTEQSSFTAVPCGVCVSLEECQGDVELWHHKCNLR